MSDDKPWWTYLGYKNRSTLVVKVESEGFDYWVDGYHGRSSFEELPDSPVRDAFLAYIDSKHALQELIGDDIDEQSLDDDEDEYDEEYRD